MTQIKKVIPLEESVKSKLKCRAEKLYTLTVHLGLNYNDLSWLHFRMLTAKDKYEKNMHKL